MRFQLFIFIGLTLVNCTTDSGSESVRILDEIPKHILEVENLTIYPGESEPLYSINLIHDQSFGASGEPYLRRIGASSIDDNGRVIILEGPALTQNLYVYNPDGTFLTQIGRNGRGPGEFGTISNLQVNAGKIFFHDLTSQRLTIFNSDDYSFEQSSVFEVWDAMDHEAVRGMRFNMTWPRYDGNLLASFRSALNDSSRILNSKYLLINEEGDVLNPEPFEIPSGYNLSWGNQTGFTLTPPFLGSSRFALSSKGEIFTAWSEDFLIKKHDADGKYQSAFYYPVVGSPFDLDSFGGFFGVTQTGIRNALERSNIEIPETYPVVGPLKVDDENRIWVGIPIEYWETLEMWVLKESGELLAKFIWPFYDTIYDIKNGYLYSKKTDDMGAESIVRYRIELTER